MRIIVKPTRQLIEERGIQRGGRVQKFIDSECIRRMAPFTPFVTGNLQRAATLGTVIGSGIIKQNTPYARKNYYHNAGRGRQGTANGGLRGREWFKRMAALYRLEILDGARRLSGARRR